MILQFLLNGCITGILYSLLAIGFALVYNTTRVFHIAAAALYVIAAYVFYFFAVDVELSMFFAAVLALLTTMGISLLRDLRIYTPLKRRKAALNVAMIAAIGLMTVLINLIAMFFGNETKVIDNTIQPTFSLGELILTTPQMYQAVIGTITIIAFLLYLSTSHYGLQLRAISTDEELYETLGYGSGKTRVGVFLLSGIFIAIASCLTVYDVGLDPHMGMNVLINAMVAMIIGGIGRFGTCVMGGMILGILQSLVVYQYASNWQNAITFLILLGFLFLRPQGIAGYKQRTV